MNDTQQAPPPSPPPSGGGPSDGPSGDDRDFDPRRLRTIADMERSSDDRIVAGVCSGAARYLNVDPIVVRVVIAVLTLAGFAGLILYAAAWLLLPADDEDRSIVAGWFSLDRNEEQVRVVGLVVALALAAVSFVGDSSWAWWSDTAWWIVPLGLLVYLVWIRPRQRREARDRATHPTTVAASGVTPTSGAPADPAPEPTIAFEPTHGAPAVARPRPVRTPRSPALFVLTASVCAIALAVTRIYDETRGDVHWTAYVAAVLAVVAVGVLVGTMVGDAGWLMVVGVLLALTLAIGSVLPKGPVGNQTPSPTRAADVAASYRHGVGELELDLSNVVDPAALQGRTIAITSGIGDTRVIVPRGLTVQVEAHVDAGRAEIFGRVLEGIDVDTSDDSYLDGMPPPDAPAPDGPASEGRAAGSTVLRIDLEHRLGNVEVIAR